MTKFDLLILSLSILALVLFALGIIEAVVGLRAAKRQQEHEQEEDWQWP